MTTLVRTLYDAQKEGRLIAPSVAEARVVLREAMRRGDEEVATVMKFELVQQILENPNWAPWKAFSTGMFVTMHQVCPEGQITIFSDDMRTPMAALNTQRINWSGDPEAVPRWSHMMGDEHYFTAAYTQNGNSLVMLNINVNRTVQGANLPARMIELAIASAHKHGITRVMGLFRPTSYGAFKRKIFDETGQPFDDFKAYSELRREDGKLHDDWLRNLERNGMRPVGISSNTYSKAIFLTEFEGYRAAYNPSAWVEVAPNVWECGECGSWTVDTKHDVAKYSESRVIGIVWEEVAIQ